MHHHKNSYNAYLNGKSAFVSVYALFDEYGFENCKIEWVEDYPCNSKKELEAREGFYIKNTVCVNKVIVGRTKEEYRSDTKEEKKEKDKKYYEEHKDDICSRIRNSRAENLEEMKERERTYYYKNKEKKNRLYECECGTKCYFRYRRQHFKTKKHQQYLQNQNNPQD
jgi:hypothetical protein